MRIFGLLVNDIFLPCRSTCQDILSNLVDLPIFPDVSYNLKLTFADKKKHGCLTSSAESSAKSFCQRHGLLMQVKRPNCKHRHLSGREYSGIGQNALFGFFELQNLVPWDVLLGLFFAKLKD